MRAPVHEADRLHRYLPAPGLAGASTTLCEIESADSSERSMIRLLLFSILIELSFLVLCVVLL